MVPRRRIALLFGLLLVLGSLGTVRALDQVAPPGGAPDPKSGPFRPAGFVRVVDGDSIEVLIDGRRTAIGILGLDAPELGTPCGDAARAELQSMVGRGVILEDDPGNKMDLRGRRVYRVSAADGRSVATTLVAAGLARTTGLGPEASTLAAAEAKARQAQTGCVGGGAVPSTSAMPGARFVAQAAAHVLANFVDETVASNLSLPTGFAFLPDGRILVAEKSGIVKLVTASGGVQSTVVDIRSRVNDYWDRGLIGIAVDPGFTSNRRFYVFYVYSAPGTDLAAPKSSQLAHFTMGTNNIADPNAGVVILGKQPGAGCATATADCLPAEYFSHAGGALKFAADGNLLVSVGDGASFDEVDIRALRAQDLDSLAGKILRVTTDGKGISSNPHWDGNADHNRSKVWARGFRNPFRMNLRSSGPSAGTLFVGDVGWGEAEEVDIVPSGMNAGWPCYEGSSVQDGYASYPVCDALIHQANQSLRAKPPLFEWGHTGRGGAALMGSFYNGTTFPTSYSGALFYGDYAQGWIKSVKVKDNNQLDPDYPPTTFAGEIAGPVQIETGPDGALWYLAAGSGELHRILYVPSYTPITCPDGQYRAEYFDNPDLLEAPDLSRCETAINHRWGDGNNGSAGSPASGFRIDHFSARWTGRFLFGNDTYDFTTSTDDGIRVFVDGQAIIDDWTAGPENAVNASKVTTAGQHTVVVEYFEDTQSAVAQVSWASRTPNDPPTPSITSPAPGAKFKVGEMIQLQGSASDPQGSIPSTGLRWDVILKHCPGFGPACHDHPFLTLTGANPQFQAPNHGDGTSLEIRLTATDTFGLTGVTSRVMAPKTVQVTLAATPSVGTVSFDGLPHTPPYTTTTMAGSSHTISAQPPGGQLFGGWTHGGAQSQTVTLGEQNVTYTANMGAACAPRPRVTMTNVSAGANARLVTISATTNPTFSQNTLKSIQFHETRASTIEAPGVPATSAPRTITYPSGTTQATFTARRSQPGTILVSFTVTDDCGDWKTFVGSGSTAGF